MKQLRIPSQIFIFIAFFLVPLFDIFRLDLIYSSFYLFTKQFSLEQGYVYLLAVLFVVFSFITLSKLANRLFCSWICPHNTLVTFINKVIFRFPIKNQIFVGILFFFISLIFSFLIAITLLFYFISPFYIYRTLMEINLFSFVGVTIIILSGIFFTVIYFYRQKFCQSACPYGHFQKIWSDNRFNHQKKTPWINWLLLSILVSLFMLLITFTFMSKPFEVKIIETISRIEVNDQIIFAYEIQLNNLSRENLQLTLSTDLPENWESINKELISVPANKTEKTSLTIKIPREALTNYTVVSINIYNPSTFKSITKNLAIQ